MPSQLSGATAVAIQVYQALYGKAPSNALLASYTAQASANAQQTSAAASSAFANDLASGFSTTSNAALALQVLNNVNITATTVTQPGSYATLLSALEAAFLGFGPASRGQIILNLTNLLAKLEGDATYGVAATGFNNQAYANFVYGSNGNNTSPGVVIPSLSTFNLTGGIDNVQATAGDDLIISRLFSLQTSDVIAGGAGKDTLYADVANPGIAITAETTGVEVVQIRAQTNQFDSSNNNIQISQIDAQRMVGVNHWESNNSRSDLVIEDVRILANQITKDITIAMVETDPGHVDFGVYFDQLSLRSQSNTTSVLAIEILDTRSAALGTGPLKDNPYDAFAFLIGSTNIIVRSPAIDTALTYADLRAAIDAAITALKPTQPLLANFTVTLGAEFTRFDTQSGQSVKGTTIVLTDTSGGVLTTNPLSGFATSSGFVPPVSGLHTSISTVATSTTEKVTSKVILDDVGRGSTGGDLVIGGLSTGATSSSKGVERFEIEVRDNSKLESINSTNNTLQEVTFINRETTSSSFAYGVTVKDKGNLTVNGNSGLNGGNNTAFLVGLTQGNGNSGVGQQTAIDPQTGINAPLPGSAAQTARDFGFSDVRLLDGSAMTGQLAFTAEITGASIPKYMNLRDTGALPASDNIAFSYSGGSNNDAYFVQIDGSVAGSRSTIVSGREDFTFTANGGAGNDAITMRVVNSISGGMQGGAQAWYTNQKLNANIFINGGDGNDTIRKLGAGDVQIDAGAGDDTVYSDNTGNLGVSAVSGSNSTTAAVAYAAAAAAELAAAQNARVLANKSGFVTSDGAPVGTFLTPTQQLNIANGLVALDLVTTTNPPAPQVLAHATLLNATQNAATAGAITLAQKQAIDAAYGSATGGVITQANAIGGPSTIVGAVASVAPNATAAQLVTGDAKVAEIIKDVKAAEALNAAADLNVTLQNTFLTTNELAVITRFQAVNGVEDGTTVALEIGTAAIVAGLAALQLALVNGALAASVITAIDTATTSGVLAAAGTTPGAVSGAAGAGTMTPTTAAAVLALLSPLSNTAVNNNTAAQAALVAAQALVAADVNFNARVAAGPSVIIGGIATSTNPIDGDNTNLVLNTANVGVDVIGSRESVFAAARDKTLADKAAVDVTASNAVTAALTAIKTAVNVGSLTADLTNAVANANAAITAAIVLSTGATGNGAVTVGSTAAVTAGVNGLAALVGPIALVTGLTAAQELTLDTGANGVVNPGSVDSLILLNKTPTDLLIQVAADTLATSTQTATASAIATAAANSGVNSLNVGAARAVYVFDTTNQTSTYNRLTQDDRNLADLKSSANDSNNFFNSTVKVTFKGLDSIGIVVAGTGFKTSDLEINQAIKKAINDDAVLSKLLLATDGPANTLVVSSLIDGVQTTGMLGVTVTMPTTVTSADLAGAIAAYSLAAGTTDAALLSILNASKVTFDGRGDYVTQFAESGAAGGNVVLVGANSTSSSDNKVTPGVGNDVIVLGTTVGVDASSALIDSSNEVVVYSGTFGNDTIVNFAFGGLGIDKFDFTALKGTGANFGSVTADKSILVGAATAVGATALTDLQIAALFTDSALAINHVYVAVDSNNIGSIWQVADAAGVAAGNVTATLVGTIDLADTSWSSITAANFV